MNLPFLPNSRNALHLHVSLANPSLNLILRVVPDHHFLFILLLVFKCVKESFCIEQRFSYSFVFSLLLLASVHKATELGSKLQVSAIEPSFFHEIANTMSSQKPVIVVSHGAWHVPAHYEPTAKPLREAGYEVIIPKQKSIGSDIPSDSGKALHEDAEQIAGILREQWQGRCIGDAQLRRYCRIRGCGYGL